MTRKKGQDEQEWSRAKKICHLNDEEVVMAKRLHMLPGKLLNYERNAAEDWKEVTPLMIRRKYDRFIGRPTETLSRLSSENSRLRKRLAELEGDAAETVTAEEEK